MEHIGFASLQMLGGGQLNVLTQFPEPLHVSGEVHSLPSSQESVAGLGSYLHKPDEVSQEPGTT
jgi:hypothetical protein